MTHVFEVRGLTKQFTSVAGMRATALNDVSFSVEQGEFLTIVGPSGCGKSTLLQILAGIQNPDTGSVNVSNSGVPLRFGFVFQANSVFPWRTVEGNLSYALELKGLDKAARRAQATKIAQLVGLAPDKFLNKFPRELSGGENRRVAIGMALAYDANVLFMDEPTSQLDFMTRFKMQQIVQELWLKNQFTAVYVTHDIDESILLGDRVMVLDKGIVKEIIPVKLPRPRNKTTFADPRFIRLQEELISCCER